MPYNHALQNSSFKNSSFKNSSIRSYWFVTLGGDRHPKRLNAVPSRIEMRARINLPYKGGKTEIEMVLVEKARMGISLISK